MITFLRVLEISLDKEIFIDYFLVTMTAWGGGGGCDRELGKKGWVAGFPRWREVGE